jgi:hypothetical protein
MSPVTLATSGMLRRCDAQAIQHLAQRLARRRHDLGVEGVAHGNTHRTESPCSREEFNGFLHRFAGAAHHRLSWWLLMLAATT